MRNLFNSIVLIFVLFPLTVRATSTELKRLNKCYGLFVRERILSSDPLWKEVAGGKKSGTDACMEIFDKAKLDSKGEISRGSDGKYDYEGMKVLNTFLRFHNSQLEAPDFSVETGETQMFTSDVIDSNEGAYHFLYSIFGSGSKFSDVVTRDYTFRAVRYSEKGQRARSIVGNNPAPTFLQGLFKTGVKTPVFAPQLVETGLLVGMVPDDIKNEMDEKPFSDLYGPLKFDSRNVNQHMGAGAIGTQSYLIGNFGKFNFSDGGTGLYRRWGKNVLSDLLCRDLPALRSKDVLPEVHTNSNIAFRTGISCMTCHSAMDPMAGTVRNLRQVFSFNVNMFVIGLRVQFVSHRTPDMESAPMPTISADSNFYRRPAEGRLFYRSYDGSLVKEEIEGLEELGQAISQTNDLYVCAAKRYYRFLTGINVSLADIGDINTPVFTSGEKFQRNKVINYGLELKQHQSIRTLIKRIIESESFINPDRGV